MYLKEIETLLEKRISPKLFKLSSEFYGIQYGRNNKRQIIKKVLITLDLSLVAIHYAIKNKFNLIISHHGLINKPINHFNSVLVNKLTLLSKNPISIFVLNSSFLAAEYGIVDTIVESLFLKVEKTFNIKNNKNMKVPIGRICTPQMYNAQKKKFTLEDLMKRIKNNLEINYISYVGDLNKEINKICVIGARKNNINYLGKAIKYGAECVISRNINHFEASFARDAGISVVDVSHYKSEIVAMRKLSNILSLEFPYDEFFCFESKDPIKMYS